MVTAIVTLSTALVFPVIMVILLWPLGLDGLWLNQAASYIPVGVIAFVMLRRTQKTLAPHHATQQSVKVTLAQHEIIKQLASQGDCVIVGRCADILCREMDPLNIFVYADRFSKLARCQSRAEENEHFSEKEMLRKMKKIDKERAAYHELFTEETWGRKESYHLCINTSGREIKTLVPALAEYAKIWFDQKKLPGETQCASRSKNAGDVLK